MNQRGLHIAGGVVVAAFIGLGAAIPAFGIFLGPFFKFGGGLVGAGIVAYLQADGGRTGLKLGGIVGIAGGILSAIVAAPLGALLNAVIVADAGQEGGQLILAIIGFFTGWIFMLMGALLGGGLVGYLVHGGE